jgi:hypothetical protein
MPYRNMPGLNFSPFDNRPSQTQVQVQPPAAEKPDKRCCCLGCCSGCCSGWYVKPESSLDIFLLVSRISAFTIASCLLAIGLVYIQMANTTSVDRIDCILMLALVCEPSQVFEELRTNRPPKRVHNHSFLQLWKFSAAPRTLQVLLLDQQRMSMLSQLSFMRHHGDKIQVSRSCLASNDIDPLSGFRYTDRHHSRI